MTEKYIRTHDWKVRKIHVKTSKKTFYCLTDVKTIALSSLFSLSVLYNTIPWSLEMSKKENIAARRMVVKSDLLLHTRQGFWYFLVPNLQSWESCEENVYFPYCCILVWRCNCCKYNIQKIITFLPSWPLSLSSCLIGCFLCDRNLLKMNDFQLQEFV